MKALPEIGDNVRLNSKNLILHVKAARTVYRQVPYLMNPMAVPEFQMLLVYPDGNAYGWIPKYEMLTDRWDSISTECPIGLAYKAAVTQPVVCDCGAVKARTTHSNWCSTVGR